MKYLRLTSENDQNRGPLLPVGTVIDRWVLDSVLGQGSEGSSFLGRLSAPGQFSHRAVIKIRHSAKRDGEDEAMLSEAEILSVLSHPYLPALMGSGVYDGLEWFALTYKENSQTLADLLQEYERDDRRLSPKSCLRIFKQLAEVTAYIHQNEVVHGDIKPENILVLDADNRPSVCLIDFGMADVLSRPLPNRAWPGGTPPYLAPETFQRAQQVGADGHHKVRLTRAADAFSLGVCLYEMLTGASPFPEADDVGEEQAQSTPQPEPLFTYRPDLGPAWQGLLDGLLDQDQGARERFLAEIFAQLDRIELETREVASPTGKLPPMADQEGGWETFDPDSFTSPFRPEALGPPEPSSSLDRARRLLRLVPGLQGALGGMLCLVTVCAVVWWRSAPILKKRPQIAPEAYFSTPHDFSASETQRNSKAEAETKRFRQVALVPPSEPTAARQGKKKSQPRQTGRNKPLATMQAMIGKAASSSPEHVARTQALEILRKMMPAGLGLTAKTVSACDSISDAPIRVQITSDNEAIDLTLFDQKEIILLGFCKFHPLAEKGAAEIVFNRIEFGGKVSSFSARAESFTGKGYIEVQKKKQSSTVGEYVVQGTEEGAGIVAEKLARRRVVRNALSELKQGQVKQVDVSLMEVPVGSRFLVRVEARS